MDTIILPRERRGIANSPGAARPRRGPRRLASVEMLRLRVAERVAHGGHDIPVAAIERRFARSLRHLFDLYTPRVNRARCYFNSGDPPVAVFTESGGTREILNQDRYDHLQREARA